MQVHIPNNANCSVVKVWLYFSPSCRSRRTTQTALSKCYISSQVSLAKPLAVCGSRCASWLAVPSSALHPDYTTTKYLCQPPYEVRGLTEILCCGNQDPLKGVLKFVAAFTTPKGLWGRAAKSTHRGRRFQIAANPIGGLILGGKPNTASGVSEFSQSPKGD